LLLLEDLAPARTGDQLAGCSVDQAAIAVAELPRLHAPRWSDPALAAYSWLHRTNDDSPISVVDLYQAVLPGFAERYASRLDADVLALAERFAVSLPGYQAALPAATTVVHGDYRLDNLLFGTAEGGPPVGVVDWQTVYHGPGVADLAYFLGAGLLPGDRRAHEGELVRLYRDGMAALGVGLDGDELWEQYRLLTMGGVIMAVIASMIVQQTDRGDDMFMAMANRHGRPRSTSTPNNSLPDPYGGVDAPPHRDGRAVRPSDTRTAPEHRGAPSVLARELVLRHAPHRRARRRGDPHAGALPGAARWTRPARPCGRRANPRHPSTTVRRRPAHDGGRHGHDRHRRAVSHRASAR
jgi:hypothetical protein